LKPKDDERLSNFAFKINLRPYGMAIMDTMKHIKSDVGTVAFGSARAVAGLLLAGGKAVGRCYLKA